VHFGLLSGLSSGSLHTPSVGGEVVDCEVSGFQEHHAFAASLEARNSNAYACGVLRIAKLIWAKRNAFWVSPPVESQNSAAWSANASGCNATSSSYRSAASFRQ